MEDIDDKDSVFYIREKIEVTIVAERVAGKCAKLTIVAILILYMYGAICLKYVSGAKSFVDGISQTFWGNSTGL